MRPSRLFLLAAGLIFVLIMLNSGAFVEPRDMDHENCKESFLAYMLSGECTPLDRGREQGQERGFDS